MKANWLIAVVMSCLVVSVNKAQPVLEQGCLVMPDELVELAEKHGYTQVTDFYNQRPGYTEAPFVYGWDENRGVAESVAFWCRSIQDSASTDYDFFLMLAVKDNLLAGFSIVAEMEWYRPCGLSILSDSTIPLSNFAYLDDRGYVDEKSEPGPKDVYMEGNAILGAYEDYEVIFYEHEGRWLAYVSYDW